MQRSARIRLAAEQTWQLLVDEQAQQLWLGAGSVLRPVVGNRVQLCHDSGPWRAGRVVEVVNDQRLVVTLAPAPGWGTDVPASTLTFTVDAHPKGGAKLTVVESEDGPAHVDDVEHFWTDALQRFDSLVAVVKKRRDRGRQAVVIIHGIGEQEPGTTLKRFVEGALKVGEQHIESWSKPDRTSRLFELRRITLKASADRPTTEVFELYWAHVIRDTTTSQVTAWMRHLLMRTGVPRPFRLVWFLVWVLILAGLGVALATWLGSSPKWLLGILSSGVIVLLATTMWRGLGKSFVIDSVGDAARYLTPRPANIDHRQKIREAGVDLLDALHRDGRYDRIVIVGHSLGSVIALDVLSLYWIRVHRTHARLRSPSNKGLAQIEVQLDLDDPVRAQELQHEAWKIARANGQPWLVTDLVTMGSPLYAADFLLATSRAQFEDAKAKRELPTCPPMPEVVNGRRSISFSDDYTDRFGTPHKTFASPHHAAPFAVTRRTNLHFPSRLLGDPIGGPVSPQFGAWVRDVPLASPKGRRFFLHSCYWRPLGDNAHIAALQGVLALDSGVELREEMRRQSPLLYLPEAL